MSVDSTRYSFEQLLSKIVDNRGKTCPVSDDGIPLIATNCVKNETLYPVFEKVRYVDQETYESWFRGHPEPGDLIFVTKGSPGNVCLAPEPVNFCIAQDMVAIRANREIVDPKYLFALLRSPAAQESILNMHVGTLIPHFKKGDFKNLYFEVPDDLELQKGIGEVYLELCEKIELNRQINTTLESMAQALFKSWFVDFDPVIDNALAAGNPIPDALQARADKRAGLHVWTSDEDARRASATEGASQQRKALHHQTVRTDQDAPLQPLPADIRALFPDSFVFNEEMGWVPEGWGVEKLGRVTDELRRGVSPKYVDQGGVCVLNQKCVRDHLINFKLARRHDDAKKSISGRELWIGDVLVNSTGMGTLGRVAQVINLEEPCIVDSHVTVVRPAEAYFKPYIFGQMMLSKEVAIEAMGEGSTGQTELSRKVLAELCVLVPDKKLQEALEPIIESLYQRVALNIVQMNSLIETRDLLLPRLMSGKLRLEFDKLCEIEAG